MTDSVHIPCRHGADCESSLEITRSFPDGDRNILRIEIKHGSGIVIVHRDELLAALHEEG